MASTPTSVDLVSMFSLLNNLASKLDSIEEGLTRIEDPAGSTIAATYAEETAKKPPFRSTEATKGKGRAQAPRAPSKAKPAKKERATPKAANLPNPVPLHLAQTFPMEGKTDRHLVTVVISDASAQHVVGQGGKGLKQIHDISGARVRAYEAGSSDERHVSIRGTDLQIGNALVVLGKRLARKKVRPPRRRKPVPRRIRLNMPPSPLTISIPNNPSPPLLLSTPLPSAPGQLLNLASSRFLRKNVTSRPPLPTPLRRLWPPPHPTLRPSSPVLRCAVPTPTRLTTR
jgi:hypothetical protein